MTKLSALSMLRSALLLAVCIPASVAVAQDLNVNGSLCVGLDCPPPGGFGFDTIVLRENNLRIFFDDTSVSAGFPANKWRITINDSASGGANFFSVDDATASRSIFKVTAGAPANSLFVASSGNVGLGTAAPGLDLSIQSTDTPAIRLEQTNGGGFTAWTWDIGGNEANFFVRDLTSGSRLPFRIRPGAPTSSIDINATGNVGIGSASASQKLQVGTGAGAGQARIATDSADMYLGQNGGATFGFAANSLAYVVQDSTRAFPIAFGTVGPQPVIFGSSNTERMRINATGSVQIAGLPNCANGIVTNASGLMSCSASSRLFKTVTGELPSNVALANVMALRPQVGSYNSTPDVPEHWLIAEEVAAVDPALVGLNDGKPFTVKIQNVVADLIAVVQQQQRQIEELRRLAAAK